MWKQLFSRFSEDIGIDLGTSNTRIYVTQKGIVIDEPSLVAINERTNQIIGVGHSAKDMMGKTPPHLVITKPLAKGIISDFEITEKMLKYFIDKIHEEHFSLVPRPEVITGVPLEITEVERKAVEDATLAAGARKVHLVQNAILGALGARLPITEAVGNMIVDIGGGKTEVAVVSLNGVVTWKSLTIAGDEMTKNITNYAKDVFNLLIGEKVAEQIKHRIGSAIELPDKLSIPMRGRDLITGLPKEIEINDGQVRESILRSLRSISHAIKVTLESTPPELVADIYERGVVLIGGGALLKGIDQLISAHAEVPVRIADDPLTCVARGTGILLENKDLLAQVALPSTANTPISFD
jgi:rod shape-determining protein MreB